MHNVVIDTNVFISGILFGGNPRKIIEGWLKKQFIFCLSPELKAEILSKLQRKFLLPQSSITTIENALDIYCHKYLPTQHVNICTDRNDNFLLDLADESQAMYIITGDKKVLALKNHNKTLIISPKTFVDLLDNESK